ncbi:MAG: hypothetical protein V4671_04175 [Armatimonadota bacterium]
MTLGRSSIVRLTTVIGLSLFIAGGVFAQAPQTSAGSTLSGAKTAETGAKRQKGKKGQKGRQSPLVQALATLTLTSEQKAKITPLTDKYREETRGVALTPEARRAKSKKLQEDVNAVLTPEQQTKLRVAMAKINGPMVAVVRELELTPEQRTKVTPIVQKASEDIAKLNGDTDIKGKQKREKMQAIVKTAVASMKSTGGLTDAQKTKLDAAAAKIGQRKNAAGGAGGAGRKRKTETAKVGAAK